MGSVDFLGFPHNEDNPSKPLQQDQDPHPYDGFEPADNDFNYMGSTRFPLSPEIEDEDALHDYNEFHTSMDLLADSANGVDTSMLTLSTDTHGDGVHRVEESRVDRRLPPAGLTPINTQIEPQKKYIGIYSPEARKKRVQRFFEKRKQRVWTKKVKYDVRKKFADSRLRVKGRFVKKEDEELLRELMNLA